MFFWEKNISPRSQVTADKGLRGLNFLTREHVYMGEGLRSEGEFVK